MGVSFKEGKLLLGKITSALIGAGPASPDVYLSTRSLAHNRDPYDTTKSCCLSPIRLADPGIA